MSTNNRRTIAFRAITRHKLSPSCWAVLMVIASYINPNGISWPSIRRISDEANGMSESTVKRATADAVKLGLVEKRWAIAQGKWRMTYKVTLLPEPLLFDKSKQTWQAFVRENTRDVHKRPGETKAAFAARQISRLKVV